jgi:hypothetical protein
MSRIYTEMPADLISSIDAEVARRNADSEAKISRAGLVREILRAHLALDVTVTDAIREDCGRQGIDLTEWLTRAADFYLGVNEDLGLARAACEPVSTERQGAES